MKKHARVVDCQHPRYTHRVRVVDAEGKRKDRYFTNKTEATKFAKEHNEESGKLGSDFGFISEDERAAVVFWRHFTKTTDPEPPELVSVLRDFKASWLASKASKTVSEAVAIYLDHHRDEGSSARHLDSLKSRLGRFELTHGERVVSSIRTTAFTEWLNGLRGTRADKEGERLSQVTRHNFTRTLRSFFTFAMEQGWTQANPVPAEKRSKNKASKLANNKAPAIMMPTEVGRFMNALQKDEPSLVAFWSLKFFAGIRDAEAARMSWNMIDLQTNEIHLPAEKSKTAEARTIKIEPNLAAWLSKSRSSGPIAASETTRKRKFKRIIAGLAKTDESGKVAQPFDFPSNAARHCFGTYHLFQFRNAGETALQLGHKGNPAMLHEHYKNPTAQKHAAAFWQIFPSEFSQLPKNVVELPNPNAIKGDAREPNVAIVSSAQ